MQEDKLTLVSNSTQRTIQIGSVLGKELKPGDIISLIGDLGSGKTCFARGVAIGLEADERYISSPSFIIVNVYPAKHPVYHIDLYRLSGNEEIEEIGIVEMMEEGKGVYVVEWADRMIELLPSERMDVHLTWLDASRREITLVARGERYIRILERLKRCLS
jgi:tRNA threonylcarbamoyladenosine biosynthesis protein TsaE